MSERPVRPTVSRLGREGFSTIVLADPVSHSEASIVPELGANVIAFSTGLVEGMNGSSLVLRAPLAVIDPVESLVALRKNPTWYGVPILAPFPGRVAGARFRFQNREITLRANDGYGNSLHGVASRRPWLVEESGADESRAWVGLRMDTRISPDDPFDWPYDFDLSMRVTLASGLLRQELKARNRGILAMPFGLGLHPYFSSSFLAGERPDFARRDAVSVAVEADYLWEQMNGLPTGSRTGLNDGRVGFDLRAGVTVGDLPGTPVKDGPRLQNLLVSNNLSTLSADDRDGGLADDSQNPSGIGARLVSPEPLPTRLVGGREERLAIILRTSRSFRALVFFTPPWSSAVSLEPHTILPDGFNLEARGIPSGMIVLPPGQEWRGWVEYGAGVW